MNKYNKKPAGWTMGELMIVVALLGLLATLGPGLIQRIFKSSNKFASGEIPAKPQVLEIDKWFKNVEGFLTRKFCSPDSIANTCYQVDTPTCQAQVQDLSDECYYETNIDKNYGNLVSIEGQQERNEAMLKCVGSHFHSNFKSNFQPTEECVAVGTTFEGVYPCHDHGKEYTKFAKGYPREKFGNAGKEEFQKWAKRMEDGAISNYCNATSCYDINASDCKSSVQGFVMSCLEKIFSKIPEHALLAYDGKRKPTQELSQCLMANVNETYNNAFKRTPACESSRSMFGGTVKQFDEYLENIAARAIKPPGY